MIVASPSVGVVLTACAPEPAATARRVLGYGKDLSRGSIAEERMPATGYPVGSGIVESANKVVVEARLKGRGRH